MADFPGYINIPSNIKQYYLPFVLDKNNTLNSRLQTNEFDDDSTAYTQVFSFRPSAFKSIDDINTCTADAAGFLRIAPHDIYRCYEGFGYQADKNAINNDISYKTLYDYQYQDNDKHKIESLDYADSVDTTLILDSLPTITIREYLQESKLNMVTDFLKNSFSALQDGFAAGSQLAEMLKNSEDKAKIISTAFKNFDFTERLVSKFCPIIQNITNEIIKSQEYFSMKSNHLIFENDKNIIYKQAHNSVMLFPYAIYYLIISSLTTNIYEVPFSGKTLYASQGGGFSKSTFGGLSNKGESLLGTAINWFGKNLTINMNPTWDGPQDTPTKIDLEFTLYNDSLEGALKNFIFINTIVPGNKWLQYHIFQHAPNLYDVKINGIDRLFMCQGDFTVEYAGQLRTPSANFISELVGKHSYCYGNHTYFSDYDNIRIPDQYNVKMTFTSLLPNNFNNFLYSYWYNTPIQKMYGSDMVQKGIAGEFMDKALSAVSQLADEFNEQVAITTRDLQEESGYHN